MRLLTLERIRKSYRRGGVFRQRERVDALADVSLAMDERTCLGLVGPSGAGKSTLGRIALGLERPDIGTVRFMGCDLTNGDGKDFRAMRRHLQGVFQDCLQSINPRFKASEAIGEPLRNFERLSSRKLRLRIGELLEMVGLKEEDGRKYPHQFSGGELQRVCIARAVAPKPRLIVLDEAVSGLDVLVQAQVLDLLSWLQQELKMAFLFISHDLRVIRRLCDRVAVLHFGRIIETSDEVTALDQLSHPASKALLNAVLPASPA